MIARPARQACDFYGFGPEPRIAPRGGSGRFRRSIYSHYWRRRGGSNVQGPGVPANEQAAALDERPQLGQIELAKIDDPVRLGPERRSGRSGDAIRCLAIRRS